MPTRRFTIADLMILVPAAAIGTMLVRSSMPGFSRQVGGMGTLGADVPGFRLLHAWLHGPGSCLVVPWMAAMIVIRLRRPRPRRSRLARQPGFVACLAVLASLLPGLLWYASIRHRPGFQRPEAFEQVWMILVFWSDTAVCGSWLALALARRWQPEPSWIDRMARALGLYWVVLLVASYSLQWWQAIARLLA